MAVTRDDVVRAYRDYSEAFGKCLNDQLGDQGVGVTQVDAQDLKIHWERVPSRVTQDVARSMMESSVRACAANPAVGLLKDRRNQAKDAFCKESPSQCGVEEGVDGTLRYKQYRFMWNMGEAGSTTLIPPPSVAFEAHREQQTVSPLQAYGELLRGDTCYFERPVTELDGRRTYITESRSCTPTAALTPEPEPVPAAAAPAPELAPTPEPVTAASTPELEPPPVPVAPAPEPKLAPAATADPPAVSDLAVQEAPNDLNAAQQQLGTDTPPASRPAPQPLPPPSAPAASSPTSSSKPVAEAPVPEENGEAVGGRISAFLKEHGAVEIKGGAAMPFGFGRNGGELNPLAGQVTVMGCAKVAGGLLQGCAGPKVTVTPEISRGEAPQHETVAGTAASVGGVAEGRIHPLSRLNLPKRLNVFSGTPVGDLINKAPDWLKGYIAKNADHVAKNTAIGVHGELPSVGVSHARTPNGDQGWAVSVGLPYVNFLARFPILGAPGVFVDLPLFLIPQGALLFHSPRSLAGGFSAAGSPLPVSPSLTPPLLPEVGWTTNGVLSPPDPQESS